MVGLNEKDMGAVIHNYDLKAYYYPTLFPLKETNRLDWKLLEAQAGLKIAADIVSRGSTVPRKTREAISRIQGDIPKISISREKLEDELTEYDIMVAMASNNPDLTAIVEFGQRTPSSVGMALQRAPNGLRCSKFPLVVLSSPTQTTPPLSPNTMLTIRFRQHRKSALLHLTHPARMASSSQRTFQPR